MNLQDEVNRLKELVDIRDSQMQAVTKVIGEDWCTKILYDKGLCSEEYYDQIKHIEADWKFVVFGKEELSLLQTHLYTQIRETQVKRCQQFSENSEISQAMVKHRSMILKSELDFLVKIFERITVTLKGEL